MAEAKPNDVFPLSVITANEPVRDNRWIDERWRVVGVVAGEPPAAGAPARTLVHAGPDGKQYLWPGFGLRLHKHDIESYRLNLLGKTPSVYVVCQIEDDGELVPVETSADYVEAGARREAGDEVYPVSMPPEVYRWLEAFVVEHYQPEEPRMNRKRRDGGRSGPRSYEPND